MKEPNDRSRSTVSPYVVSGLICLLFGGTAGLSAQPLSGGSPPPALVDPSDHRPGMIVIDGAQVPYLDWGGTGVTLVFLAGAGNTAHVFDEFAPRFTDNYRVIGVTRVGFGESGQPENNRGTDLASRVEHVRAVLDALQIPRAVLIGHSLGGDEITAFAGAYPERTAALIYLDSGIDHTATMPISRDLAPLRGPAPQPDPADLASPQAYQRFLTHVQGVEFPIGEVLATAVFDSTGAYLRPRVAPFAALAVINSIAPPDFTTVRAPALALFSDLTVETAAPWLEPDSEAYSQVAAFLEEELQPALEAERVKFQNAVSDARVFAYWAHHHQFLSMPEDTERRIRQFLSSLGGL